jgi:hypothetical protein
MSGISCASSRIDFSPSDVSDIPAARIKAEFQVAALKTQQDMQLMQGRELARLMEPHKGGGIDRYA